MFLISSIFIAVCAEYKRSIRHAPCGARFVSFVFCFVFFPLSFSLFFILNFSPLINLHSPSSVRARAPDDTGDYPQCRVFHSAAIRVARTQRDRCHGDDGLEAGRVVGEWLWQIRSKTGLSLFCIRFIICGYAPTYSHTHTHTHTHTCTLVDFSSISSSSAWSAPLPFLTATASCGGRCLICCVHRVWNNATRSCLQRLSSHPSRQMTSEPGFNLLFWYLLFCKPAYFFLLLLLL